MSPTDLNTRCTAALRALEGAGVIRSAWLEGQRWSKPFPWVEDDELTEADRAMTVYGTILALGYTYNDPVCDEYGVEREGFNDEDAAHDLSDPVTAASLIVLVREAWGREGLHACRRGRGIWCVSHDPWMHARKVSQGATEVEALVAALEAKVREVCGG